MNKRLRLHYAPDNASLCVRLALEALGFAYETVLVNRSQNAQRSAEYLALNPNGRIPALQADDMTLFETGAILLWLADQAPDVLFPAPTAEDRAAGLVWLFWLANTLHPAQRRAFYPDQYGSDEVDIQGRAHNEISQFLDVIATHGGEALKIPLIQCYLCPLLRWCAIYGGAKGFDLMRWPILHDMAVAFETQSFVLRSAVAEGLGDTPFSNPSLPNPPEGSAT